MYIDFSPNMCCSLTVLRGWWWGSFIGNFCRAIPSHTCTLTRPKKIAIVVCRVHSMYQIDPPTMSHCCMNDD